MPLHLSGRAAESRAARHLRSRGLALVARNYRCRFGELDLVMRDGDVIVFVEVRYRHDDAWGSALESVTAGKQQRLRRAARHFLVHNNALSRLACRFDVVALSPRRGGIALEWIQDAF